jgi:hypothetical protein
MTDETHNRSSCCGKPVTVGGDDEDGTHYYICSECGSPCDVVDFNHTNRFAES